MIFIWAKFKGCFCQSMKTLTKTKSGLKMNIVFINVMVRSHYSSRVISNHGTDMS